MLIQVKSLSAVLRSSRSSQRWLGTNDSTYFHRNNYDIQIWIYPESFLQSIYVKRQEACMLWNAYFHLMIYCWCTLANIQSLKYEIRYHVLSETRMSKSTGVLHRKSSLVCWAAGVTWGKMKVWGYLEEIVFQWNVRTTLQLQKERQLYVFRKMT